MTMTPLIYMLALIISIVILLVLTLKLKMNSFMHCFLPQWVFLFSLAPHRLRA